MYEIASRNVSVCTFLRRSHPARPHPTTTGTVSKVIWLNIQEGTVLSACPPYMVLLYRNHEEENEYVGLPKSRMDDDDDPTTETAHDMMVGVLNDVAC